MSDDIQLSDLLESYPSSHTEGFQTLISEKEEFVEMKSIPHERLPPGKGQYFKHQHFTHRFLRAYDSILIMSETGSGKSCEVIGFCEKALREHRKALEDPDNVDEKLAHFKKVVVIVNGKSQKAEFRNQLICKCSDGQLEQKILGKNIKNLEKFKAAKGTKVTKVTKGVKTKTETEKKPITKEKAQKTNVDKVITKAGYELVSYRKFARKLRLTYFETNNKNDVNEFVRLYSDTIFWIDEAHNFTYDPSIKSGYKEKVVNYETILHALQLSQRKKIILSTATPMINSVIELIPLFNLLLPVDPFVEDPNEPGYLDLETATLDEIEPHLRGNIGYIKATDIGAYLEEQGEVPSLKYDLNGTFYDAQFVIYPTWMSEFQTEGYIRASEVNTKEGKSFRQSELQASNFVFPNSTWGGGGEDKPTKKSKSGKTTVTKSGLVIPASQTEDTEEKGYHIYVKWVNDRPSAIGALKVALTGTIEEILVNIGRLSCKMAAIVRLLLVEEDVLDDNGNIEIPAGNSYVYARELHGSGLIVLGLCLEAVGFSRYEESESIFISSESPDIKPVCSTGNSSQRRIRKGFVPKLRYAMITGDTNDKVLKTILETQQSYENRHSAYIKVVLITESGKEGINLNNIRQEHLLSPSANESSNYQALSRGFRANSHEDLIAEKKAEIAAAGGDPKTAKVAVFVYKHVAIADIADDDGEIFSVDLEFYKIAEKKDRSIKRVLRMMKQVAVGCQIHYARNVILDKSKDGTPACDYDVCQYQCYDPLAQGLNDFSTFDILYSDDVVNDAMEKIIETFRQFSSLSLTELYRQLSDFRHKYIIMALETLIRTNRPILDRFGYRSYIREDKNMFYLDRSMPIGRPASYALSYYSQGIIATEKNTLDQVSTNLQVDETQEKITELEELDPNSEEFNRMLDEMTITAQVEILEDAVKRSLENPENEDTPFIKAILAKYHSVLFSVHEPLTELNKKYNVSTSTVKKRGRPKKAETEAKTKKVKAGQSSIVQDEDSEMVYLHTLYTLEAAQTSYSKTSKFTKAEGRIRLLKTSENEGWRDLNNIEYPIYNELLQVEIYNRTEEEVGEQQIYGRILPPDNVFKIIDKTTENSKAKSDSRSVNRGRTCKDWQIPNLYDLMWKMGFYQPDDHVYNESSRQKLVDDLMRIQKFNHDSEINSWEFDRVVFYYKWYTSGLSKPELCGLIRKFMEENDMLLK